MLCGLDYYWLLLAARACPFAKARKNIPERILLPRGRQRPSHDGPETIFRLEGGLELGHHMPSASSRSRLPKMEKLIHALTRQPTIMWFYGGRLSPATAYKASGAVQTYIHTRTSRTSFAVLLFYVAYFPRRIPPSRCFLRSRSLRPPLPVSVAAAIA